MDDECSYHCPYSIPDLCNYSILLSVLVHWLEHWICPLMFASHSSPPSMNDSGIVQAAIQTLTTLTEAVNGDDLPLAKKVAQRRQKKLSKLAGIAYDFHLLLN